MDTVAAASYTFQEQAMSLDTRCKLAKLTDRAARSLVGQRANQVTVSFGTLNHEFGVDAHGFKDKVASSTERERWWKADRSGWAGRQWSGREGPADV